MNLVMFYYIKILKFTCLNLIYYSRVLNNFTLIYYFYVQLKFFIVTLNPLNYFFEEMFYFKNIYENLYFKKLFMY